MRPRRGGPVLIVRKGTVIFPDYGFHGLFDEFVILVPHSHTLVILECRWLRDVIHNAVLKLNNLPN